MCRTKGRLVALTWQDRKPIHFLSTISPAPKPDEQVFTKRRKKDGTQEDVRCPEVVQMYNKYMGAVDHKRSNVLLLQQQQQQQQPFYFAKLNTKNYTVN